MKILQTSDWHLGQQLCGFDRAAEHEAFFAQLASVVEEERPDALLVCGDVYDSGKPLEAARNRCKSFFVDMRQRYKHMAIVVVAGCSDGSALLDVERSMREEKSINIVGGLTMSDRGGVDASRHIVEVKGGDGVVKGYVVAVPYVADKAMPKFNGKHGTDECRRELFRLMLGAVAKRNTGCLPVVLMTNQWVEGAKVVGQDMGKQRCMPQSFMGDGYDYLALGGVHKAQTLSDSTPVACYAGSPMSMSFGEEGTHSLTIVEARYMYPPVVARRGVANTMPLLTIPAKPVTFVEAVKELEAFDGVSCYVRLNVRGDERMPLNSNDLAMAAVGKKKGVRYCGVCCCKSSQLYDDEELNVEAIDPNNVADVFERYCVQKRGRDPELWLQNMLAEAMRNLEDKGGNE